MRVMPYLSQDQREHPAAVCIRGLLDLCLEELSARQDERVYQRLVSWTTCGQEILAEPGPRTCCATIRGLERAREHLFRGDVVDAEHALLRVRALY